MSKNQSDIIFYRIVANLLYKRISGITITISNSQLYDLLVEESSSHLLFAVKVGDVNYYESKQYYEYISLLQESTYTMRDERLPIILMCADKESETIKFGYQLTWERYMASVHTKVTLREITPLNWSQLMDNLKEMDKVIRVLANDKISIVKYISVEQTMPSGGIAHGNIIYLRRFTDNYKMKQKEVKTEKEKYERMVWGIPENEYPNDLLDEIITRGVANIYPNPSIHSKILLLNTELQDLKCELRKKQKKLDIVIEPELGGLNVFQGIIDNKYGIHHITLSLYFDCVSFIENSFQNKYSTITYPFDEWIKNYGLLDKLIKETLREVEDVVSEYSL